MFLFLDDIQVVASTHLKFTRNDCCTNSRTSCTIGDRFQESAVDAVGGSSVEQGSYLPFHSQVPE